jgi:hypothetical protein
MSTRALQVKRIAMKRISIDTPFGHKYPGPQSSDNSKFSIGSDMVGHFAAATGVSLTALRMLGLTADAQTTRATLPCGD